MLNFDRERQQSVPLSLRGETEVRKRCDVDGLDG